MKVFISWSGARSGVIAKALHKWLPNVIQSVKPFLSTEIEKGKRGNEEINAFLEGTSFGIICLTPENRESNWIHFEAGALSKLQEHSRVWTLLHDLKYSDVEPPLSQFQHTLSRKEDFLKLIRSLNSNSSEPLDQERFSEAFEKWWPDLDSEFAKSNELIEPTATENARSNIRDDREILNEILEVVRRQDDILRPRSLVSLLPTPSDTDTLIGAARVLRKWQNLQILSPSEHIAWADPNTLDDFTFWIGSQSPEAADKYSDFLC